MPIVVQQRPERLNIRNLQTDEGFYMQFNPTKFQHEVTSSWARLEVLGQSFRPLDYLGTNNATVGFSLFFRAENRQEQEGLEEVLAFLESLQYPPDDVDSIGGRRPPRCLVVWPGSMAFSAVMTSFSASRELFDVSGKTIQATVKLEWEEARKSRLTQEAVRERGLFRTPEGGG